ncbi:sulfotransferase ssu-1-like [Uloborus diversus]|uniref:sulfotransferase ssu-1-like n=1 Tax=Uloborus diversus TaxID=327109 RepID=UPI00240A8ABD|nr:sulfotransferase ssu-1-like [Uloborus diversus]XP_054717055.1 sulfotransferase ssu-1-like [Uloborus diversus]
MAATGSRKKPKCYVHENGFIMPPVFPPDNFGSAISYCPQPSDVFICTYPKCGTTWMQNILYLLLNQGSALQPSQNINDYVPHLEEVGADVVKNLPQPRTIKTHLHFDLVPKSNDAKYIYITRNPKDCCVSFFYHCKGFGRNCDFEDGIFDDFFEAFIQGEVHYGDYFDHLLSWIAHKEDPNILFLLYEDMKSDPEGNIKKVGEFLGEPFSKSTRDPLILENVLRNCSFEAMKKAPSSCWSTEQSKDSPGFIRSGRIGNWREHFTVEQNKLMNEKFKKTLAGTEAEFLWSKYCI